jgi:hypothetical protein
VDGPEEEGGYWILPTPFANLDLNDFNILNSLAWASIWSAFDRSLG